MSRRHPSRTDSARWARVRAAVLERDDYTCTEDACNRTAVEVHHVVPVYRGGAEFDADNMVSLCVAHHRAKHDKRPPVVKAWDDYARGKLR